MLVKQKLKTNIKNNNLKTIEGFNNYIDSETLITNNIYSQTASGSILVSDRKFWESIYADWDNFKFRIIWYYNGDILKTETHSWFLWCAQIYCYICAISSNSVNEILLLKKLYCHWSIWAFFKTLYIYNFLFDTNHIGSRLWNNIIWII